MLYLVFKEAFQILYKKIDGIFIETENSLYGQELLDTKARDQAFHIEGLIRLLLRNDLVSKKQKKFLEELLKKTKSLEDSLGKMDEFLSLQENLHLHARTHKDASPLLRSQSTILKDLAKTTYGSKKWIDTQLKGLEFLKKWRPKKTIKIVNRCLAEEILRLTEKTSEDLLPTIINTPFSYDLMEYNFHEFRRNVRWIPIYIQTLQKEFTLSRYSEADTSDFEKNILKKYKANPFTQLPSKQASTTIDRFGYYMFSHTIAVSGDTKDNVETHYKLKELRLKTKLNTKKAKKEMIRIIEEFLESGAAWRLYDSLTLDEHNKSARE
ncbi:MAG: hypothetical protein IT287_01445 [Bdellovibrionaceae bacterium]|nr:hypothetical protein [Pseudobdellovibrionaceae bacterium]